MCFFIYIAPLSKNNVRWLIYSCRMWRLTPYTAKGRNARCLLLGLCGMVSCTSLYAHPPWQNCHSGWACARGRWHDVAPSGHRPSWPCNFWVENRGHLESGKSNGLEFPCRRNQTSEMRSGMLWKAGWDLIGSEVVGVGMMLAKTRHRVNRRYYWLDLEAEMVPLWEEEIRTKAGFLLVPVGKWRSRCWLPRLRPPKPWLPLSPLEELSFILLRSPQLSVKGTKSKLI